MRIRRAWGRMQATARTIGAAIAGEIGRDEVFLLVGLGLLSYGLALTPWPPSAFIVPGATLVWMALPPRKPFVVPPATTKDQRTS